MLNDKFEFYFLLCLSNDFEESESEQIYFEKVNNKEIVRKNPEFANLL